MISAIEDVGFTGEELAGLLVLMAIGISFVLAVVMSFVRRSRGWIIFTSFYALLIAVSFINRNLTIALILFALAALSVVAIVKAFTRRTTAWIITAIVGGFWTVSMFIAGIASLINTTEQSSPARASQEASKSNLPLSGSPGELVGKIIEAGATSKVAIDGKVVPNIGDVATIFFKIPGMDEEVFVGTAKVKTVDGNIVTVQLETAAGTPQKDQLVRFTSATPRSP